MELYDHWKRGETSRVRTIPLVTGQPPIEFEILPVRVFGSGPVMAVTILVDGLPVRRYSGKMMADSKFLDWAATLEMREEEE